MPNFKTKQACTAVVLMMLLSLSPYGYTEVFKWRDDTGATHYSDHAASGAQPLSLRHEHTYLEVAKVYDGDTVQLQDGREALKNSQCRNGFDAMIKPAKA